MRTEPIIDFVALVLAVALIAVASSRRWQFRVGKFGAKAASSTYKAAFFFPAGAMISIIAVIRLIAQSRPGLCSGCLQVDYGFAITPYVGWILTFVGLIGVRSFAQVQKRLSRALVIVSIVCGPFLIGIGLYHVLLRLKT